MVDTSLKTQPTMNLGEHESIRLVPRRPAWTRLHSVVLVLSVAVALLACSTAALAFSAFEEATVPGKSAFYESLGVRPSTVTGRADLSSTRMHRAELSYAGTTRENLTMAAGRNQVLSPSGEVLYVVHTEVVSDVPEAAYTTVDGITGDYAVRMRIYQPSTQAWAGLVPFGLSIKQAVGPQAPPLSPNLYLFHYMATPSSKMVVDLVGTQGFESQYEAKPTFYLGEGEMAWQQIMVPFLRTYAHAYAPTVAQQRAASAAASAAANATRRALQYSYGGSSGGSSDGTIGGEVGGAVGGDVGGDVGGKIGSSVGGDVGEDLGEAAGTALGGPVGGAIGGFVGKELGSYVGKKVGSDIGSDIGSDLGSEAGTDIGNAVGNTVTSSSSSGGYSYSG